MIVETLEPVWNGTLEARGEAPGLSNYLGRSTLCGCMEVLEALAHGEVNRHPQRTQENRAKRLKWTPHTTRSATFRRWPPLTPETSAAILQLLQRGVSYNGIVSTLAKRGIVCSRDQARKVARDHAIVRGRVAA